MPYPIQRLVSLSLMLWLGSCAFAQPPAADEQVLASLHQAPVDSRQLPLMLEHQRSAHGLSARVGLGLARGRL